MVATSLLHPKVIEGVDEKIKQKKQTAKYYSNYDRTAKTLPDIEIRQEVRVAPLERNQLWKSGMFMPAGTYRPILSGENVQGNVAQKQAKFEASAPAPT